MATVTHTFDRAEAEAIVFMLHWEIQGAADAIGNQSVSDYGHKQDEMRRLRDLMAILDAFGSVAPEDAEGGTVACKEETLLNVVRAGGEFGREEFAELLKGDQGMWTRSREGRSRAQMALAQRFGVYEGVTV